MPTDAGVRIVGPVALGTTATTLYTAPITTTISIRNIHVCNESGTSGQTFTLSIGADAAGTRLYRNYEVINVLDWSGFLVLAAGEILQGYANAATALTITISGITTT